MKERAWNIAKMEDLEKAAAEILGEQAGSPLGAARLLALHGDLGAGKTAFVQALARQLKVADSVTSPTFVVMKKYRTDHPRWRNLIHIDAYRLESPDELSVLGFAAELSDPANIICIEWAEKVEELLPPDALHLRFSLNAGRRTLAMCRA